MRVGKKPFCITKASGTNLSHLLYHKRIKIRKKEEQKQQQQKIKQEINQEKKNLCLWHHGLRSLNTANKGASPDLCPQCGRLLLWTELLLQSPYTAEGSTDGLSDLKWKF